jgi:hypothetical protein
MRTIRTVWRMKASPKGTRTVIKAVLAGTKGSNRMVIINAIEEIQIPIELIVEPVDIPFDA